MGAMSEKSVYERLSAHFEETFKDPRGMKYISGEQVVSRLNEVLGFDNWAFEVREHGYDQEADEVWVLGRLMVMGAPVEVVREQFGSQKHNRRRVNVNEKTGERTGGEILDYDRRTEEVREPDRRGPVPVREGRRHPGP
jgi:hypothetical protein